MTRSMCAALVWLAAPLALATTVGDEPKLESVDPTGKPKGYKAGVSARFAIWHEAGVWHVRTTTGPKDRATFSGTVEVVGGKMVSLTPVTVEKGKKNKVNLDFGSWNPAE